MYEHHFYKADWESLPDYVIQAGVKSSSKRHSNKQVPATAGQKTENLPAAGREEKMKAKTKVHGRGTFSKHENQLKKSLLLPWAKKNSRFKQRS